MNRVTRRGFLGAAAAVAAGSLAGCTDGGGRGSTPSPTPARTPSPSPAATTSPPATRDRPAAVGATCSSSGGHYRFAPAIQRVDVGETVRWSGASRCKQQTVAYHPDNDAPLRIPEAAEPWESPVLKRGDAFEHTFETPGIYNYFGLYEQFGQVGIVVVGEPGDGDQPGLSAPGSEVPEDARLKLEELLGELEASG